MPARDVLSPETRPLLDRKAGQIFGRNNSAIGLAPRLHMNSCDYPGIIDCRVADHFNWGMWGVNMIGASGEIKGPAAKANQSSEYGQSFCLRRHR